MPAVESLRGLTPERLAALNHGTIRTPIPGREGQEVLRRLRHWAGPVGQIRIGEEVNPPIPLQLSGTGTESIFKQAVRDDAAVGCAHVLCSCGKHLSEKIEA